MAGAGWSRAHRHPGQVEHHVDAEQGERALLRREAALRPHHKRRRADAGVQERPQLHGPSTVKPRQLANPGLHGRPSARQAGLGAVAVV